MRAFRHLPDSLSQAGSLQYLGVKCRNMFFHIIQQLTGYRNVLSIENCILIKLFKPLTDMFCAFSE